MTIFLFWETIKATLNLTFGTAATLQFGVLLVFSISVLENADMITLFPDLPCTAGDLQGHWGGPSWGGEAAWWNQCVCAAVRLPAHELQRARRHPLERPQVLWGGGSGRSGPLQGKQRVSVEQEKYYSTKIKRNSCCWGVKNIDFIDRILFVFLSCCWL